MPSGAHHESDAHTRRPVSAPSSPMSNAVSRPANVSATIRVLPSGVMTVPLGKDRSSAAMCAEPSGSMRIRAVVGGPGGSTSAT